MTEATRRSKTRPRPAGTTARPARRAKGRRTRSATGLVPAMREFVQGLSRPGRRADVLAELTETTEEVKQKIGNNPDMWQAETRFR